MKYPTYEHLPLKIKRKKKNQRFFLISHSHYNLQSFSTTSVKMTININATLVRHFLICGSSTEIHISDRQPSDRPLQIRNDPPRASPPLWVKKQGAPQGRTRKADCIYANGTKQKSLNWKLLSGRRKDVAEAKCVHSFENAIFNNAMENSWLEEMHAWLLARWIVEWTCLRAMVYCSVSCWHGWHHYN